jgi:hypothetical protein
MSLIASVENEVQKIEGEVVAEVQKLVGAADDFAGTHVAVPVENAVHAVETVAKEAFDAVVADVAKLRSDFDAFVARIEKHNTSGTPFPIK